MHFQCSLSAPRALGTTYYPLYDIPVLFSLCSCYQILPLSTNIREAYKNGLDDEQCFIQNLALFICTFLREHGLLIEQKVLKNGMYMNI